MKPLLFVLFTASLAACAGAPDAAPNPTAQETPAVAENPAATEGLIQGLATVRYQDLEGGFWGLVADDGQKYDPLELDEALQQEGLRVRFSARPDTDRMSSHMWGQIVELVEISTVEE